MRIFAHRGASAFAPANSLAAFAKAREMGCVCYELDVHLSKDGHLVIHHDYNLGSDTTCNRDIKDVTLEDLKQSRLVHSFDPSIVERPPLLHEVLPVVVEELELLNIEIKNDDNVYPGIEEVLWRQLNLFGPEALTKIFFSSFDYPTLQRLRKIAPAAQISLLTRLFEPQKARNLDACSVHMNKTRITKEVVDLCHAEGREVFVYTVNDQYTMHSLERIGVDGIFTDTPNLFIEKKNSLPEELIKKYTPIQLSKQTQTALKKPAI
ncbi:MAG: hypothetical protein IKL48_00380 [Elusimicrobiaceae bacterium]|nr:hypothetical protein [Elusimicrobiaceae bacterium]